MDNDASFKKASEYYSNPWSVERKKVLKELEDIRDYVQEQARIHSIGNITYLSVRIVGGGLIIAGVFTAPFTLGVSLGLTIAGLVTSVTSGVAETTHGVIKSTMVNTQINNAKQSIEKHYKSCEKMARLLEALKLDIKKHNIDYKRVLQDGEQLFRISDLASRNVENAVNEVATISFGVTTAAGILLDLGSLIKDSVSLSTINNGQLCDEAKKLQNVINEMKKEFKELAKCFS